MSLYSHYESVDKGSMLLLGIETSCDETAVALLHHGQLVGHVVHQQDHRRFGGVMPQVAAGEHALWMPDVLQRLFDQTPFCASDIGALGVTSGPGLVGGLLVGVLWAKALACRWNIPLWPIHHLEAHGLMVRMQETVDFPYGLLLLSGGHCLLAVVHQVGQYTLLGQTYDDAAGECLDKVSRALGGPYPGGPYIEQMALLGDPWAVPLPVPLAKEKSCHFSFSGLKTACIQWISNHIPQAQEEDRAIMKANVCASLQRVVATSLIQRLRYAIQQTGLQTWVLSGGVAANTYFREQFNHMAKKDHIRLICPPAALCTDNGAVIAWATWERINAGMPPCRAFSVRPYWPLSESLYH